MHGLNPLLLLDFIVYASFYSVIYIKTQHSYFADFRLKDQI